MPNKSYSSERVSNEYLLLNNCGIQCFTEADGTCLRENGRVDFHILYLAEGICRLYENGERRDVPCGSIILFRPHEKQHYAFDHHDQSVSYFMHFTGIGCEHLLASLGIGDARVTYIGKSRRLEALFDVMLREYTLKQYAYESRCAGLLLELLSVISREKHVGQSEVGRGYGEMIMQAEQKIYEQLPNVSIDALAAEYYLSRSRFSHIFKNVTGTSPLQYVTQMRMQKAKDMLLHTDLPVCRIAQEVGYPDQNYFSRIFRRETGMTPSEFRA